MSIAERVGVPLNRRCSRKCDAPLSCAASSLEPTCTNTPTAAEPLIVLVVDELATLVAYQNDRDLTRRVDAAFKQLLSKGRAPGLTVVGALQDPRKEVLAYRDLFPTRVALRLDGYLVHAVAGRMLLGSWPHPIDLERRLALRGVRRAAGPLPAPAHAPRAQRVVGADGVVMVARQRLRIGRAHAGKTITVIAEDTSFRVLDGEHELTSFARDPCKPLTRFKAWSRAETTSRS